MAESYDVAQYLLDRANIQEAAELMYMNFDRSLFEKLISDVLNDQIVVDYTDLFGGQPSTHSSAELAGQWKGLKAQMSNAQHQISSITPELPQPGSRHLPATAKAIANGHVLIKSHKDNIIENRGRMYLDLVKRTDMTGNPWRIAGIKAEMVWERGSWEQLRKDFEEHTKA